MVNVVKQSEPQLNNRGLLFMPSLAFSCAQTALLTGSLNAMAVVATGTPVKTAASGNTGDGTIGAVVPTAWAPHGRYTVTMTAATTFTVTHESGIALSSGSTGVAYTDTIGFTNTAGSTAFVAGDIIYIDVGVVEFDASGSAPATTATGVLLYAADATSGTVNVSLLVRDAVVNGNELMWKAGTTDAQKRAAYAQLAAVGIVVQL